MRSSSPHSMPAGGTNAPLVSNVSEIIQKLVCFLLRFCGGCCRHQCTESDATSLLQSHAANLVLLT